MTNNYTDTQLKQTLAEMLPDKIKYDSTEDTAPHLYWRVTFRTPVLDTELLHLCWLVEQGLCEYTGEHQEHYSQRDDYSKELMKLCGTWHGAAWDWGSICDADLFQAAHATWQQRVVALAKVKGIEIV